MNNSLDLVNSWVFDSEAINLLNRKKTLEEKVDE